MSTPVLFTKFSSILLISSVGKANPVPTFSWLRNCRALFGFSSKDHELLDKIFRVVEWISFSFSKNSPAYFHLASELATFFGRFLTNLQLVFANPKRVV